MRAIRFHGVDSHMLTKAQAEQFAADWIAAWNSHDLDRIMTHYADDVELISPVAEQLLQAVDIHLGVRERNQCRQYIESNIPMTLMEIVVTVAQHETLELSVCCLPLKIIVML